MSEPREERADAAPAPRLSPQPAIFKPPPSSAAAPATAPIVEPPSPEVAPVGEGAALPGAHRGGYARLPTAPVAITTESAAVRDADDALTVEWLVPQIGGSHRGVAAWALGFSIGGLIVSLFVGWGFPLGIVGVVSAIIALRRPLESTRMAVWALVLGALSVLYSAGWLFYAATRANLWG
jgi:hypothetical protein